MPKFFLNLYCKQILKIELSQLSPSKVFDLYSKQVWKYPCCTMASKLAQFLSRTFWLVRENFSFSFAPMYRKKQAYFIHPKMYVNWNFYWGTEVSNLLELCIAPVNDSHLWISSISLQCQYLSIAFFSKNIERQVFREFFVIFELKMLLKSHF